MNSEFPQAMIEDEAASPSVDALAERRANRVILLVVLLWILNAFDLAFTIIAHDLGGFREANPLAAAVLGHPYRLVAFKLALVAFGSVVLLALRRRPVAELACWLLCGVYMVLGIVWMIYFRRGIGG